VHLDARQAADGSLKEVAALAERGADEGDPTAEGIVLCYRRRVGLAQVGNGVARDREEASAWAHEVDPPKLTRTQRHRPTARGRPAVSPPVRVAGEVLGQ
jgi:hypothetical protein